MTGHSNKPEFRFEPDQIQDFIEFLKSVHDSEDCGRFEPIGVCFYDKAISLRR